MRTRGRWDLKPREQAGEFGAGAVKNQVNAMTLGEADSVIIPQSPAPLIDFLSPLKNIPTMTEQIITEKKQIALTQCAELYAGQNLRLQREALKTIEEAAGRFVEILDGELNDKAD